jgi:serpin B
MFRKIGKIAAIAVTLPIVLLAGERRTHSSNPDALAQGASTFTVSLFRQILARNEGNILFSPYSISMALSMAGAGAKGKTAEEIRSALGQTLPADTLYPAMSDLSRQISEAGNGEGQALVSANAIWLGKDFKVRTDYLKLLKDYFNSEALQLDFCRAAPAAKTINDWVAEKTRGHIQDLVSERALNCDMRLVLTNAVYFLGRWASPFNEKLTEDGLFFSVPGQGTKIPMMHGRGSYSYAELEGWQVLQLPYMGGRLAMLVLLPASGSALADNEQRLDARSLDRISGALKPRPVSVTFPKFEIRASYGLNDYLKGTGIKEAFRRDADFSGITTESKLFISEVLHEAWVKVNEKGTEAAAATHVGMATGAARPQTPVEFRADHPFLFLIKHVDTGSILFWGRLSTPKATK